MTRLKEILLVLTVLVVASVMPTATGSESSKLILVVGATGQQGGAVARELLDRGYHVRGLTRNPGSDRAKAVAELGAEMVCGDLSDRNSLDRASG